MSMPAAVVEKRMRLTRDRAERLHAIASRRGVPEDQVVEEALDMFFRAAVTDGECDERREFSALSEDSLARVWENDEDAAYDNWRELYGIPRHSAAVTCCSSHSRSAIFPPPGPVQPSW